MSEPFLAFDFFKATLTIDIPNARGRAKLIIIFPIICAKVSRCEGIQEMPSHVQVVQLDKVWAFQGRRGSPCSSAYVGSRWLEHTSQL